MIPGFFTISYDDIVVVYVYSLRLQSSCRSRFLESVIKYNFSILKAPKWKFILIAAELRCIYPRKRRFLWS